jgi:hypothetical protein
VKIYFYGIIACDSVMYQCLCLKNVINQMIGGGVNRKHWCVVAFVIISSMWTLLMWGVYELMAYLPEIISSTRTGSQTLSSFLSDSTLNLFQENTIDRFIPILSAAWKLISESFSVVLPWAAYIIWSIWLLGMLLLIALYAIVKKLLNNI